MMGKILEEVVFFLAMTIGFTIACVGIYLTLGALPMWDCGYQLTDYTCRLAPWN